MLLATLVLNILLGIVCLGFLLTVWGGSLPSGPEGPVGAWIVPVPFLMILAMVMIATILRGRFDWLPGGRGTAFALLAGLMIGAGTPLFHAFNPREAAWDYLIPAIPFVALIGCFWAVNGFTPLLPARGGKLFASTVLGLTSAGGWGLIGYAFARHMNSRLDAAGLETAKQVREDDARRTRQMAEFRALPAEAPLIRLIQFEHVADEEVRREALARIAGRPDLDGEIAGILADTGHTVPELMWTISYVAEIHAGPPARLGPAYASVLERAYRYWESTLRYDEHAAKSEPELRTLLRGAERVQTAGGELRPQLAAWQELLGKARGLSGLAAYAKRLAEGK